MNTRMPFSELGKNLGRWATVALAAVEVACGGSTATPPIKPTTTEVPTGVPATATVAPTKTAFPTQEVKVTATPEHATGGELPRVVAFRENILKQMLERSHPLYGPNSPPQLKAEDEDAPLGKAGWKIILKGEGFVGVQEYDEKGVSKNRILTGESKSKPGDPELITAVDFVPSDLVNQPYVVLAGRNFEWKNGTWYRDGNLSLGQSARQYLSRDKMIWLNESDPATPTLVAPTLKPNVTPSKVTPEPIITPAAKPTEKAPNGNTSGLVSGYTYDRKILEPMVKYWANIKSGGTFGYGEDGKQFFAADGTPFIVPAGANVGILFESGGDVWIAQFNSGITGGTGVVRVHKDGIVPR